MEREKIISEITRLKKEKDVIILAHFYTDPQVQDLADYIGDSLGLSQMAANTSAKIILFCGVKFMAETASIIAPDKKVLLPDPTAGCSLAESIKSSDVIAWRKKNPDGVVVSYVNTTAEVKAHTDICCTSANAINVINSIPDGKKIFFIPDKNLASFVKIKTGKDIEIWDGDCCVHEYFDTKTVLEEASKYPDADLLIHPESNCSHDPLIYKKPNSYILSTTGMIKRVGESDASRFLVVTEPGVIHRMKKLYPNKEFIPCDEYNECMQMRKITLEKMLTSLLEEIHEVKVPEDIRQRAYPSIDKMLKVG